MAVASTTVQSHVESHAGVKFCCRKLDELGFSTGERRPSVLVAGCGAGHEAAFLQQEFSAVVTAIDAHDCSSPRYADLPDLSFREASVLALPFGAESFDLVFYHHVIEHVSDPQGSLEELSRVLRPTGWLFIGTPNRHRLVSAAGAYEQTDWQSTLRSKLGDNFQDWTARLKGRFRNEFGVHAGFSTGELDRMLAPHFPYRHWVTKEYLRYKYGAGRFRLPIKVLTNPALIWLAAPSIYAFCRKN